jgi:hypothetical protein
MYESPLKAIEAVAKYLKEPLPDDTIDLKEHLIGLESVQYELAEARVDQQRLLHEKENQMLHPKDAALNDLDRRVMLNASVAVIKRDLEFLVTLEKLSSERLSFGQKLLEL